MTAIMAMLDLLNFEGALFLVPAAGASGVVVVVGAVTAAGATDVVAAVGTVAAAVEQVVSVFAAVLVLMCVSVFIPFVVPMSAICP